MNKPQLNIRQLLILQVALANEIKADEETIKVLDHNPKLQENLRYSVNQKLAIADILDAQIEDRMPLCVYSITEASRAEVTP